MLNGPFDVGGREEAVLVQHIKTVKSIAVVEKIAVGANAIGLLLQKIALKML